MDAFSRERWWAPLLARMRPEDGEVEAAADS
jgi:hypothetical protein